MSVNLVIVESPAKAKTIEKFLGKDFKVVSSFGHIRDLSKKNIGIDIKNGFKPEYIIPDDKKKVVRKLCKEASNASLVWLASDEDREGEAIAWHLAQVLDLPAEKTKRIVFHEITKGAIEKAVTSPRGINISLVNAQQARRVLDRLVGYEISPILWKKVQPALSAGRVQSVALRLIVERERDIISFKPVLSYRLTADFIIDSADKGKAILKAEASKKITREKDARSFLELCAAASYSIDDITVKPGTRSPAPPFTTSTLQQEAYSKLGFSVSQTMAVAQRLYESGKITYMRTDSTNLSQLAVNTAAIAIKEEYGEEYSRPRQYKTKSKGAQEAHEAIRPTYMNKKIIQGTQQEKKLYELIWKRTAACQMSNAKVEKTSIRIAMSNTDTHFLAQAEVVKFDGFLKVYRESSDNNGENGTKTLIPPVKKGMDLKYESIIARERTSLQPARYTEASLVKKMEELGIGRPSTYAPVISTIQNRGYVAREDRPGEPRRINILTLTAGIIKQTGQTEKTGYEKSKLFPKNIGILVNDFLVEHFSNIIDYNFTANIEVQFDKIAEGKKEWDSMLEEFYDPFHRRVSSTLTEANRKTGIRELGADPETGEPVYVKMGRFGPVAQIGDASDDKKPRFASLLKGQLLETIQFKEALELFKLPRKLDEYEGHEMLVGIGRFGPFVKHNNKFYSLKKGVDDPYNITSERAIELIQEKRESDKKKEINRFGDILVLKGRYGPYISYKKKNYKIPKGTDPESLSEEDCLKIIEKNSGSGKKK
ncbi:MAG TPA: type I DNA topoisomerase [Bacteroidales bacterium]|nr:type I DNA topoisomerase [Bacteroidales bacterium]